MRLGLLFLGHFGLFESIDAFSDLSDGFFYKVLVEYPFFFPAVEERFGQFVLQHIPGGSNFLVAFLSGGMGGGIAEFAEQFFNGSRVFAEGFGGFAHQLGELPAKVGHVVQSDLVETGGTGLHGAGYAEQQHTKGEQHRGGFEGREECFHKFVESG